VKPGRWQRLNPRVVTVRLPARSRATTRSVWRPARKSSALIHAKNRPRVTRLTRLPSSKTLTLRIPDASRALTRSLKSCARQGFGPLRTGFPGMPSPGAPVMFTIGPVSSGTGAGGAAHWALVTVLLSSVVAALRAKSLTSTVAP
jgi:hypothetical protein